MCHHEDYYFDYVFSPGATEDEISGEFPPLIRDALHGDFTLIGTYGETDPRKTFLTDHLSELAIWSAFRHRDDCALHDKNFSIGAIIVEICGELS